MALKALGLVYQNGMSLAGFGGFLVGSTLTFVSIPEASSAASRLQVLDRYAYPY
jgi:hypothetical protein